MVVFGLSYLEKEPTYYCPHSHNNYVECSKDEACEKYPG